jgi:1-deoxy-D-xylulose-5-phosphate reductoisomerase
MKRIAILGATGSIGVNCLQVVDQLPGEFQVAALSTHNQVELLLNQAAKYRPQMVAVSGRDLSPAESEQFGSLGVKLFSGPQALSSLTSEAEYDLFVNAVVGAAGFAPTLKAVDLGKNIALANKEALVMGGELVTAAARRKNVLILPIDSEHSAIFQCLMGEDAKSIEQILLTASGGPFRKLPKEQFHGISVEQALRHPNWKMGKKITIDSATMMNKGLEVIEAHWLFAVAPDKVRVVIHPQSIIHSMVAFWDGSVKAQMGIPDMRVPIQLALTHPQRMASNFPRLDLCKLHELTFEEPDLKKFRALALAYSAAETGGTAPAAMNAANEESVALFLKKEIRFDQIAQLIEETLNVHASVSHPEVEDLLAADSWARSFVKKKAH